MVPVVVWVPAALLVALLLYIVLMSSYAPSALDVRGKHMVITGEATRRGKTTQAVMPPRQARTLVNAACNRAIDPISPDSARNPSRSQAALPGLARQWRWLRFEPGAM